MRSVFLAFILATRDLVRSRAALHVELVALRHQLSVLNATGRRAFDCGLLIVYSGFGWLGSGGSGARPSSS